MTEERYTDWQLIGTGGTAEVYRAIDHFLDCTVAIKLLNDKYRNNTQLLDGLREEVKISRALRHPNICPIHDKYEGARGFGIVMDFIDGYDLRDWMDENNSRLRETIGERLTVFLKVTEALELAHAHIIHRDLKPANIFLKGKDIGRPLIMDFGISIAGSDGEGHKFAGTLKYASAEQYETPELVDRRSDLFTLGILAYELMTREIPPCSLVNMRKIGHVPHIPISAITPPSHYCELIPPALDRIILHMLDFDPNNRPASASEVLEVLRQIIIRDTPDITSETMEAQAETVAMAGGEYFVGSGPNGETVAEKPMRRITITGFEMAVTTVTNREYRVFLERTGHQAPPWIDHLDFGRDDHPVVGITWDEAVAYAKWSGGRLPTECEWECAAKAGEKLRRFPWGEDQPGATKANIDGIGMVTTPVRGYPGGCTPLGLWDMCGNVWEWCADVWDENLYRNMSNGGMDPCNNGDGPLHSIRGGSYDSLSTQGRCAFRSFAPGDDRRADIGIRVVFGPRPN